jgi:hypothetical protein
MSFLHCDLIFSHWKPYHALSEINLVILMAFVKAGGFPLSEIEKFTAYTYKSLLTLHIFAEDY